MKTNDSPHIILASGSRYRREMLARLGIPFEVLTSGVDETPGTAETGADLAARLGVAKARAVGASRPASLVIGCDQVAECRGRLLGKPGSVEAAVEQLLFCSAREVVFHSSVAMVQGDRIRQRLVPTRVRLKPLDEPLIRAYVERDRPLDCAGAMKSESLGIALAESISSDDPTALIGLPLIATIDLLEQFGVAVVSSCAAD